MSTWNIADLSAFFRQSISTTRKHIRAGTAPPPSFVLGRKSRRWLESDVLAWLEARRKEREAADKQA